MAKATAQATIGERLAAARRAQGWTQDEVVDNARYVGLLWNRVTVATIEADRRRLTAAEVLLLPVIYEKSLLELLCPDDTGIALDQSPLISMSTATFAHLLKLVMEDLPGYQMLDRLPSGEVVLGDQRLARADPAVSDAERRAARDLGIAPAELRALALKTFGRSLTEERDRRVREQEGELPTGDSLAAARGHVMRDVIKELKDARKARRKRAKSTTEGTS